LGEKGKTTGRQPRINRANDSRQERDMRISKIALIMAMMDEARPLIDRFGLRRQSGVFPDPVPMEVFVGKRGPSQLALVWNGRDGDYGADNVATQPATLAAYLAITKIKPDIIISAGTAGGFVKHGASIGDVYLSRGVFRYHDRRIPYADFAAYGIGSYPGTDVSAVARDLGCKLGEVSTGNSLETIAKDVEVIDSYGASIKEMEAAAVAWVCRLFQMPMFAMKTVVDLVDGEKPSHEQFGENLRMGSARLQQALVNIIDYCGGKTIAELAK